ncbi:MAG: hypothetical protein NXH88_04555, partial [Hyphomonas sp.]|nr:hypothetical protein [Hyphomonas sp.]
MGQGGGLQGGFGELRGGLAAKGSVKQQVAIRATPGGLQPVPRRCSVALPGHELFGDDAFLKALSGVEQ